jgi:hypothetical protein
MSRANPRFHRTNAPLPAVPIANSVAVFKIVGAIENQLTVNTFYYLGGSAAPNTLQIGTLGVNLENLLLPLYQACISADWTMAYSSVDIVDKNTFFGSQRTTSAGLHGTRTAGHFPTEVAMVIARYSLTKGQHGRGRISLPAIALADVTASTITSATLITAQNALAVAMLAVVSDGTNNWSPCIAQRSTTTPRLVIGASLLQSIRPRLLLGTVRRRKIGRGK